MNELKKEHAVQLHKHIQYPCPKVIRIIGLLLFVNTVSLLFVSCSQRNQTHSFIGFFYSFSFHCLFLFLLILRMLNDLSFYWYAVALFPIISLLFLFFAKSPSPSWMLVEFLNKSFVIIVGACAPSFFFLYLFFLQFVYS